MSKIRTGHESEQEKKNKEFLGDIQKLFDKNLKGLKEDVSTLKADNSELKDNYSDLKNNCINTINNRLTGLSQGQAKLRNDLTKKIDKIETGQKELGNRLNDIETKVDAIPKKL